MKLKKTIDSILKRFVKARDVKLSYLDNGEFKLEYTKDNKKIIYNSNENYTMVNEIPLDVMFKSQFAYTDDLKKAPSLLVEFLDDEKYLKIVYDKKKNITCISMTLDEEKSLEITKDHDLLISNKVHLDYNELSKIVNDSEEIYNILVRSLNVNKYKQKIKS